MGLTRAKTLGNGILSDLPANRCFMGVAEQLHEVPTSRLAWEQELRSVDLLIVRPETLPI
jgi:hypothetical protein